jgi:hypothetical protein
MSQEQLELLPKRARKTLQEFPLITAEVQRHFQQSHVLIVKGLADHMMIKNTEAPVRSGFYLTIWIAYTGNYLELAWFDVAAQTWIAQNGREMPVSKFTVWIGVNEQIGRTRRTLL